jgi:hypothetical protein
MAHHFRYVLEWIRKENSGGMYFRVKKTRNGKEGF